MNTPSRRYLSVWLRRLATDRIANRLSAPDDPLVIAATEKSALRLSAVNDAAAALGLSLGMPLADARAMYPNITVADSDDAPDHALLEAVADWCDRYTPLVGLDAPDGLTLDISGCAHLFGGEAKLATDLTRRLGVRGLQARAAVAGTVGCAWGMARYGAARIVASGEERTALSALPLAALRLASETLVALAQVGLRHIADVLDRPRAPLAARFGAAFVRRIDQALGREDEPITPRLPVPAALTEQRFAEPVALERDVLGTIERLAGKLAAVLERRGEGARLLQAALFRADGRVFRIEAGTSEPLHDAKRIARLFIERLSVIGDECDPGFGFDMIRLAALVTERTQEQQAGLAAPDHTEELAHLIDRLGARFGLRRVTRQMPADTHIPEFAVMAVGAHFLPSPSLPSPLRGGSTGRRPVGVGVGVWGMEGSNSHHPPPQLSPSKRAFTPVFDGLWGEGARGQCIDQDSLAPTRPIRLFAQPEPIEATAEVPDGPPAQFTWRRVRHVVAHVEGPERIGMEWWRDEHDDVLMRDYFRVETREGVRVWLFRRWPNDPRDPICWFVHGVFA
jgi:protein ImuB